jgi:SMC interacting uncharacterized protein involved in chromosome segregation
MSVKDRYEQRKLELNDIYKNKQQEHTQLKRITEHYKEAARLCPDDKYLKTRYQDMKNVVKHHNFEMKFNNFAEHSNNKCEYVLKKLF